MEAIQLHTMVRVCIRGIPAARQYQPFDGPIRASIDASATDDAKAKAKVEQMCIGVMKGSNTTFRKAQTKMSA